MPIIALTREKQRYRAYLAAVDLALAVIAVLVAKYLVLQTGQLRDILASGLPRTLLVVPCWLVSLYLHYQYDFHPRWGTAAGAYRNVRAVLIGSAACIALLYALDPGAMGDRRVHAIAAAIGAVLFTLDRLLAIALFPDRVLRERYLVLGVPAAEGELAQGLSNGEMPPYVDMVGCIRSGGEEEVGDGPLKILGGLADVPAILAEQRISHVAVCPDVPRTAALSHAAAQAEALGATVERLETVYEGLTGRAPVLLAGADWAEGLSSVQHSTYTTRYKRVLDFMMALFVLPLALLVMATAAVAIKIASPGPILYRQKRVGNDGQEFLFTKLRTMIVNAEKDTGPVWATDDDPRITKVGGVLRKLRLDELPQLFSVLKGDMSLVGPRPERPEFVAGFIRDIPFYEKRLLVRPGITGWAQVNHKYDETVEDVVEKLRYDLYYVRHTCFSLDLQILLRTFWVMIGRKGAK